MGRPSIGARANSGAESVVIEMTDPVAAAADNNVNILYERDENRE